MDYGLITPQRDSTPLGIVQSITPFTYRFADDRCWRAELSGLRGRGARALDGVHVLSRAARHHRLPEVLRPGVRREQALSALRRRDRPARGSRGVATALPPQVRSDACRALRRRGHASLRRLQWCLGGNRDAAAPRRRAIEAVAATRHRHSDTGRGAHHPRRRGVRAVPRVKNLMNRVNFAHTSGVIVDVCTKHGTWFDADELRRVLEFITSGGLEAARARELRQTPISSPPVPASALEDPWRIVRPILDGDDAKLIINALVTFTGRRKI